MYLHIRRINKLIQKNDTAVINYIFTESEFGTLLLAADSVGLYYTAFVTPEISDNLAKDSEKKKALHIFKRMFASLPGPALIEGKNSVLIVALNIILGKENSQELVLFVQGTDFQIKVWELLTKIPKGLLCSYKDIAVQIENPKAVRAVGAAVGANPVALIIPCHRVVRSDGRLGGYHWGIKRKAKIIDLESNNVLN